MGVGLPLRVLCLGLGLLPLRRGDAALDGKGGAVGAGHPEARGIASNLDGGYAELVEERVAGDYSLCVHGKLQDALVSIPSAHDLGTEAPLATRYKATANTPRRPSLESRKEAERLTFTRPARPLPPERRVVYLLARPASW